MAYDMPSVLPTNLPRTNPTNRYLSTYRTSVLCGSSNFLCRHKKLLREIFAARSVPFILTPLPSFYSDSLIWRLKQGSEMKGVQYSTVPYRTGTVPGIPFLEIFGTQKSCLA
jgi:hypothetical protein